MSKLNPDAAMRYGIKVYANEVGVKAKVSRVRVSCVRWTKVGQTRRCTGSFRLTKHGRDSDYRLDSFAGTFLNTPTSVMYKVAAKTAHPVAGLRRDIGDFAGFYPR